MKQPERTTTRRKIASQESPSDGGYETTRKNYNFTLAWSAGPLGPLRGLLKLVTVLIVSIVVLSIVLEPGGR